MHSSLSIVKYFYIRVHWFYIKSNSGRILYWILLHSFTLLPNWEGVFREKKYSWKVILEFAFSRKKKVFQITASSETKSINQPRKGHFDSVQLKYSSRSAQIHVKIDLVTDHYPIRWITSHILSTNSTQKKRLKIKILLESFPF